MATSPEPKILSSMAGTSSLGVSQTLFTPHIFNFVIKKTIPHNTQVQSREVVGHYKKKPHTYLEIEGQKTYLH